MSLIIASLVIFGIHTVTRQGMVLGKPADWVFDKIEARFNEQWAYHITKPIFECPACMSSVWGTVFYFWLGSEIPYILFIFALCGLNYIVNKLL